MKTVTKCSSGNISMVIEKFREPGLVQVVWMNDNLNSFVCAMVNQEVDRVWISEHVAINSNCRSHWRLSQHPGKSTQWMTSGNI
jgi:hypothetical protein